MNPNRKQRAFAPLSEQEYEQVGEWVLRDTYEAVRQRVNAPRPEGFGLNISIRPLQTLHEKKTRLQRLCQHLQAGQKITIDQFDALCQGDATDLPDEIHDAILQAARDLALNGDNTATDLLALQRLADFPVRAAQRAQRFEVDLVMRAHKIEMDLHRKEIAEKRLALAERALALREQAQAQAQQKPAEASPASPTTSAKPVVPSDHLGPLPTTYEDIRRRTRALFGTRPSAPVPPATPGARPSGVEAHHHQPEPQPCPIL